MSVLISTGVAPIGRAAAGLTRIDGGPVRVSDTPVAGVGLGRLLFWGGAAYLAYRLFFK